MTWLSHTLELFLLMAPYLLLGFVLAGLLHVLVPQEWVARHLGGRGWRAAFKGALIGTPLPLCSCGVIPFAGLLRRQGASKSAIVSFLISTPQTGVDSILAAYAILGLPLALWKVLTAMVSGVIGGSLAGLTEGQPSLHTAEASSCCVATHDCGAATRSPASKVRAAATYGLGTLIEDVAIWLVIGTFLGGAISAFVPDALLANFFPNPYIQMLAVLVIAVPLYVCATGSVPVAAALILKGMPLGAAIVFLIAGPATNVATLSVFTKVLGRRTVGIYLGTIIVVSIAFGILFQLLFPGIELPGALPGAHAHGETAGLATAAWWEWGATMVLGLLVLRALAKKARARRRSPSPAAAPDSTPEPTDSHRLSVVGMNCGHCTGQVEQALKSVPGVIAVTVSLEHAHASVQGRAISREALIAAVEKAGFRATPI